MSTPSETEIFVSEDNISRTTGKPKKKPRGPPMTPERKAQLLENLKRGRENSAKKRKEMAEAKKAKKKAEEEELFSHVKPKPAPAAPTPVTTPQPHYDNYGISSINNELKELRLMMKEMKMERETERQKAEIRALKDQIALLSTKKKEIKMEETKPEPKPEPKPTPTPAPAPQPMPLRVMSTHADSPLSRLQRFA